MADVVIDAESKNPKQLLGQGIKAYILQDYDSAVAALSKASELLVTEHGSDLHESLGEVYLYYGKSLLGLSREESNVLGKCHIFSVCLYIDNCGIIILEEYGRILRVRLINLFLYRTGSS